MLLERIRWQKEDLLNFISKFLTSRFLKNQSDIFCLKDRIERDFYYILVSCLTALRSTCLKAAQGCVIVVSNRIVSTGYNGAPSKEKDCLSLDRCLREESPPGRDLEFCRAIHAEQNAVAWAARYGISLEGGIAYITALPCGVCLKLLKNAGLSKVVFLNHDKGDLYRIEVSLDQDLGEYPNVSLIYCSSLILEGFFE